jgi:hypothetical protein
MANIDRRDYIRAMLYSTIKENKALAPLLKGITDSTIETELTRVFGVHFVQAIVEAHKKI